jgi:hypothetical protein
MKTIIFFSCMVLFYIFCMPGFSQSDKITDWELNELKGKIKKRTVIHYLPVDGITGNELKFNDSLVVFYNEQGYETSWTEYNDKGKLIKKNDFLFDKNNNRTEIQYYGSDDIHYGKTVYKYNENGETTEITSYDKTGEVTEKTIYINDGDSVNIILQNDYLSHEEYCEKKIYQHNSMGKETEMASYDCEGKLRYLNEKRYDSLGELIECKHSDDERKPESRSTYTYDEKGNMAECTEYGQDGYIVTKTKIKYDTAGNKTEEEDYMSNGKRDNTFDYNKIRFNSKGKKTEFASYDSENKIKFKDIYTYDSLGNETEYAEYDTDEKLVEKLKSKYDPKGNMIECAYYDAKGTIKYKTLWAYDEKGNILEKNYLKFEGNKETPEITETTFFKYFYWE